MSPKLPKPLSHRNDEDRRKELADFIKIRRARVKPSESRHPFSSHRRTPGLRREEVAEMAGVSASWYTWLEQARDIRPSVEFLIRLSQVLHLNPFESNHLFNLAGRIPPEALETNRQEVPPALEQLIYKILQVPAYVMGERFDILIWNKLFTEKIFDVGQMPEHRRTVLDMIFTEEEAFQSRPEWEEDAKRTVAEFRWSVGKQVGSPWVKDLVTRMCAESPKFSQLWRLHDVQERKKSRIVELRHQKSVSRYFIRSIYIPLEAENLRLVIFNPVASKKGKLPKESAAS
jgi:transcriptional regulator with XRE-family HTH domain